MGAKELGFTLIEVLVALTVMAIAVGAAVKIGGQSAQVGTALSDRTQAVWVAAEAIEDLRIRNVWPDVGEQFLETGPNSPRDWDIRVRIEATADERLRKLTVGVAPAGGDLAARLFAYLPFPGQ